MVECIAPTQFDIRTLPDLKKTLEELPGEEFFEIDLANVETMDAAAAQFLSALEKYVENQGNKYFLKGIDNKIVRKVIAQICIQTGK